MLKAHGKSARVVLPLAVAALSLQGCPKEPEQRASEQRASTPVAVKTALLADQTPGEDWPAYGRTYGEQHFSPLRQIDAGNVPRLNLAWSMDLDVGNPATGPIEIDGTLYFATGLSVVHAVEAETGTLLWRYDPQAGAQADAGLRVFWGNRGIAWWNGKVYVGTVDGRLIAIDARSGKEVWSVQTLRKGSGQFISGPPRAFDGKIIIGQGGGDTTDERGYATAYDAETGRQVWRFYIVPGNPANGFENKAMEMAAKTWSGEWWKHGGGGQPWNAFTYDAKSNTILIGTGNGSPWNRRIRSPQGGDNLFLCSIVAVDASSGEYKWHYQINPGETWDYNAAMDMQLADLMIEGRVRQVLMTAPKNGFLYVIDRTNGELISAGKIAKVSWASHIDLKTGRPVEVPSARFPNGEAFELWPGPSGAHSWMPPAYSTQTQLLYIPKIEAAGIYSDRGVDFKHWVRRPPDQGESLNPLVNNPLQGTSSLLAWDPVGQKQVWKIDTFGGWNGGVLATAGNLVFEGQLDGRFSAYAADSGKELWHFPAQAPVLTAPITYSVKGHQYVTVLVGLGTSVAVTAQRLGGLTFDYRTQRKRALTFMLDGKATLPPAPAPAFVVKPIADPEYRSNPPLAARGQALFIGKMCLACHGYEAISGGGAPDLRGSPVPTSAEAFASIVHDGALVQNGMPRFGELSSEELAALRQYIRRRAAQLRTQGP